MVSVGAVKAPQRRVGRRAFLALAGLGACGAGAIAAPHIAPRAEQGIEQAALNVAAGEFDQLEGVSLDAALEAAQITAAACESSSCPWRAWSPRSAQVRWVFC